MATKDSEELKANERYPLGDYSFRIERTSVPGSSNDKIEAICTDKDGKNARKSIQVPSSQNLLGWYVEANETEATVYALIKVPKGQSGEVSSDVIKGTYPIGVVSVTLGHNGDNATVAETPGALINVNTLRIDSILASAQQSITYMYKHTGINQDGQPYETHYTSTTQGIPISIDDKVAYYTTFQNAAAWTASISGGADLVEHDLYENIAWSMIYGTVITEYDTKEMLVGRFAIEIEEAGGVGPGSDWVDPGDYDPDWEEGDPTHTLYVTVTGALSGRHNDPIEDPSYSYIPSDKDTVKDYGCGGDGGHGGGGGAGASTVVIHKFATNQANSKEVTALARRHGYGSGGGKGGKGGDGCILVYY